MLPIRTNMSRQMTEMLVERNSMIRNSLGRRERTSVIIAAEIVLCWVALRSVVDVIAYAFFALVTSVICPVNKKPCLRFLKLLESSAFTIIWAIANALIFNFIYPDLREHESDARDWVGGSIVFRPEDRRYIRRETQENFSVVQGANFLVQDVLANASDETKDAFLEVDSEIVTFILTKAAYIYAFGAKKGEEIPSFFKSESRASILALRFKVIDSETLVDLQRLIKDPREFEIDPESKASKFVFNKLKSIAYKELQGSLLCSKCWKKAISLLSQTTI